MTHVLKCLGIAVLALASVAVPAQTFTRYTSTNGDYWKESRIEASEKAEGRPEQKTGRPGRSIGPADPGRQHQAHRLLRPTPRVRSGGRGNAGAVS